MRTSEASLVARPLIPVHSDARTRHPNVTTCRPPYLKSTRQRLGHLCWAVGCLPSSQCCNKCSAFKPHSFSMGSKTWSPVAWTSTVSFIIQMVSMPGPQRRISLVPVPEGYYQHHYYHHHTQGFVVMEPFLRSFCSWKPSRCEAGGFFPPKAAHEFAGTNVILAASPPSPASTPNMRLHHYSHCPIPFFHNNICFCW